MNTETVESPNFDIKDIKIGTCQKCNIKQESPGKGGIWLTRNDRWICYDCKRNHKIRNYPMECEWCQYKNVKWYQGNTYDCPRCNALGLKFFQ